MAKDGVLTQFGPERVRGVVPGFKKSPHAGWKRRFLGVLWFADNNLSLVPKFWVSDRQNMNRFAEAPGCARVRYLLSRRFSVGTIIDQLIFYWQAIADWFGHV